ncbi:MAG: heat-inducible transcriptional repressor HrcA [Actinomycetota bacterium]
MLSDRKAAILQAVVEGYISTSEPVGSTHVVSTSGLDVSSATVRTEMAALEEDGYLQQPHTSAGRVPSEKGYRYFVDSLMEPRTLGRSQQQKVSSFFRTAQGELELMLQQTSGMLARMTDYAAVVVGPPAEVSPVRGIQAVRLADDQALLVAVHANASIERRVVAIEPETTDDDLDAASRRLIAVHVDRRDDPGSAQARENTVFATLSEALAVPDESPVFVGGASTVAGSFEAVEQVQEILTVLEKQYLVVTLVSDILERGMEVAIGSETGMQPLSECSLVVAPVEVDGVQAGSIGLLGPTRMHYAEAMATVAYVSQQLGGVLREGTS